MDCASFLHQVIRKKSDDTGRTFFSEEKVLFNVLAYHVVVKRVVNDHHHVLLSESEAVRLLL